jgi:hypothetical protein
MLKKRILRAPDGAWIILSGARLAQFKVFLHRIFAPLLGRILWKTRICFSGKRVSREKINPKRKIRSNLK